ncbi:MAG: hypothetical protein PUC40_07870 [Lachnospiraceae bacterium]|nr:hypothetical protein [Lachnospiraceae bacterium]
MNEYTDFLENAMTEPGMEDVSLPYLKDILGEFRKLPERLDEFIRIHGYDDDMTDENEKADFGGADKNLDFDNDQKDL